MISYHFFLGIKFIGDIMEHELLRLKKKKSIKYNQKENIKLKRNITSLIIRLSLVTIITLITLILLKSNSKWKTIFYKHVYDTNFSFATINKQYQKYFGSSIPFSDIIKKPVETVFDEKLQYQSISLYKDGAKLTVNNNYLIPVIDSGMVVFIGKKGDYNNTVIIQGMNGVDTWYGNIGNVSVKLYDYVSKGSLLGETKDNNLYLVFKKDGKVLDYKKYIK